MRRGLELDHRRIRRVRRGLPARKTVEFSARSSASGASLHRAATSSARQVGLHGRHLDHRRHHQHFDASLDQCWTSAGPNYRRGGGYAEIDQNGTLALASGAADFSYTVGLLQHDERDDSRRRRRQQLECVGSELNGSGIARTQQHGLTDGGEHGADGTRIVSTRTPRRAAGRSDGPFCTLGEYMQGAARSSRPRALSARPASDVQMAVGLPTERGNLSGRACPIFVERLGD